MDIKGWTEDKEPDDAKRDVLLKRIYLSAKMMKFHPLMTKELRKSYSLMASAALRVCLQSSSMVLKKNSTR